MGNWGIAETATPKEKLKSKMADFLNGLNSVGEISYKNYCEIFDFSMNLLDKMYDLEKTDPITKEQNEELKLMLGVILESHKKGYSNLTPPIVKRVKELLK
ncbi:TPA: hypothetical protein ACXDAZ_003513 [Clostridium botulinum]|uniref:hypothetical protein n=1 Tax=Clostridium botulinum TaxID=1491 RepID=UPI0008FC6E97|nr:hypothetical protein [Clostridium botulinum]APC81376.1 hypothetical protein NPD2_198 [Clostridium botulinum]MCS4446215.1 hypothetical protein [Clostridium botulinum]MCS4456599.1 hypothetical protein [Clostridium botulinum]MCS4461104.1 hypothetical protein [Clostridium botulinum]MCS4513285.1 hypothetical protein [Clostridium botulinum]